MNFKFQPSTFVHQGSEVDDGDWSYKTLSELNQLKANYPELEDWGLFPICSAWGDYSQDFYEVSWCDWNISERDDLFLNYIYHKQTYGKWTLSFSPDELSKFEQWRN